MQNDGVGAIIKLWGVFLLVFVLLGYPVLLAMVLGGVGGFAAGLMVSYWNRRDQSPPKKVSQAPSDEGPRGLRSRLFQRQPQPGGAQPWWQRVFRRSKAPTFRSRRQK